MAAVEAIVGEKLEQPEAADSMNDVGPDAELKPMEASDVDTLKNSELPEPQSSAGPIVINDTLESNNSCEIIDAEADGRASAISDVRSELAVRANDSSKTLVSVLTRPLELSGKLICLKIEFLRSIKAFKYKFCLSYVIH